MKILFVFSLLTISLLSCTHIGSNAKSVSGQLPAIDESTKRQPADFDSKNCKTENVATDLLRSNIFSELSKVQSRKRIYVDCLNKLVIQGDKTTSFHSTDFFYLDKKDQKNKYELDLLKHGGYYPESYDQVIPEPKYDASTLYPPSINGIQADYSVERMKVHEDEAGLRKYAEFVSVNDKKNFRQVYSEFVNAEEKYDKRNKSILSPGNWSSKKDKHAALQISENLGFYTNYIKDRLTTEPRQDWTHMVYEIKTSKSPRLRFYTDKLSGTIVAFSGSPGDRWGTNLTLHLKILSLSLNPVPLCWDASSDGPEIFICEIPK